MKENIAAAVKEANSLAEVREALFTVFKELRRQGQTQIGYISGAITADGPDKININLKKLADYTEQVRQEQKFPVFSPTDVFNTALFARLNANGFKNPDWEIFWQQVLGSENKYVTEMFMTPGWERSHGATDEHRIAKEMGMNIVYLTHDQN